MKKKLLLVLSMVAILACLFALSVSAAEFTSAYTSDVTTFDSEPDFTTVEDKTSTAVLKLQDGSYVRIPAYYVYKEVISNKKSVFNATGTNFTFGWVSEQLEETVTLENLVAIEIPNGTVEFKNVG